jgi:hypothetical protein
MKKDSSLITDLLSIAAIAGNVLFVLWILFNGINEGFKGTRVEKVSFISLMGLLVINAFLLIRNRKLQNKKQQE